MRPAILFPLFTDVSRLKGVGEHVKAALGRLLPKHADEYGAMTRQLLVRDLVFHLPVGLIDRRASPPLNQLTHGAVITATVTVDAHYPPPQRFGKGRRTPYKVLCSNETGSLMLVFFHVKGDYIARSLPIGEPRVVSGKVELNDGVPQIAHPDRIATLQQRDAVQAVEPVYPLTYALSNRQLTSLISRALAQVPALPEWVQESLSLQHHWKNWKESLLAAHRPQMECDLSALSVDRTRLAYDELLANQLALALVRTKLKREKGGMISDAMALPKRARTALPFSLTQGQEQVLSEIRADLRSGDRMLRLLQGDVGSGKTVVALMAMLEAIEAGYQCAVMVPTEIVARQHLKFIRSIGDAFHLRVELLTGSVKDRVREDTLQGLNDGSVHIVVGTQALFQDKVEFHNLGLIVIDEQHRFGVKQRLALSNKGANPHILLMTATPIPRSLEMTAFGDMDSSCLREKPAGRRKIDTRVIPLARLEEVVESLPRAIAGGNRVYWICPLVEEAEPDAEFNPKTDLAAAVARFAEFKARFGDRAALVHGRMKTEERDHAMRAFAEGRADILVATTVVEVGVDVPEATVMVIEHAERFGLSQLHQLRGRVGRSKKASSCILLYDNHAGNTAKARLKAIRETEDGFHIAEQDLALRGSGDVLGTRQSGVPEFHFADLAQHGELLSTARNDAKYFLAQDPLLQSERGKNLRVLLHLFDYDANIRYLGSG